MKGKECLFYLFIAQDPAVTEAVAPTKDTQEDYNPFTEEAKNPEVVWSLLPGVVTLP